MLPAVIRPAAVAESILMPIAIEICGEYRYNKNASNYSGTNVSYKCEYGNGSAGRCQRIA